jgi:hypothetical protein
MIGMTVDPPSAGGPFPDSICQLGGIGYHRYTNNLNQGFVRIPLQSCLSNQIG